MVSRSEKIVSREQAEKFLDSFDHFLFDCDGVLWTGNKPLPHVAETIDMLRARGKKLIFVTNNSTKSRRMYKAKFEKLGIKVNEEDIFGSSYAAAYYLSKVVNFPKDKKVLLVGEAGMEEEVEAVGLQYVGGTDPAWNGLTDDDKLAQVKRDPSIGAVLVGLDLHINYAKIANAMAQLRDTDVVFLATNTDSTFPSHNMLLPGAGTVVRSIETCSGREALPLGKPSPAMMECIKQKLQFDPKRTCMVGDRLNTDMLFGQSGGLGTLFVLTGVDTEASIMVDDPIAQPDFYMDKLGSLYELVSE